MDGEERTHQVQLMRLIYKKCQECIVYLGDSLDSVGPSLAEPPPLRHFEQKVPAPSGKKNASNKPAAYEVFSIFHDLSTDTHLYTQSAFSGGADVLKNDSQHNQIQHRLQLFEALRKFAHAPFTPWWTRIWVIQELTTPPRVVIMHGTVSASWDMFAYGAFCYTQHSAHCCKGVIQNLPPDQEKVVTGSCKRILGLAYLRMDTNNAKWTCDLESLRLLSLLTRFRDRKASDPRDKVYALLSMTWTPPGRTSLVPDYSLSKTEVFRRAALESIYTTESLSIFSTELGRKLKDDLPSWIPDWEAPGGYMYTARAKAIDLYNANREKATPLTIKPMNDTALRLRAFKIMTVAELGETMLGEDTAYTRQTLRKWWYMWNIHTYGIPVKTPVDELFAKLICAAAIHCTLYGQPDGVRTVQAYDAKAFETWAAYSSISPVGRPDDIGIIDHPSVHTQLWKQFMLLWPNHPLLQVPDTLNSRDKFFPNGLDNTTVYASTSIYRLRELLYDLDPVMDHTDYLDDSRPRVPKPHAPWEALFIKIQEVLQTKCGLHMNLNLDARKSLIPEIDNSISIATLWRRLIIGENSLRSGPVSSNHFFGLGPAETVCGDEVFILNGGKTPFVLRRHTDTDEAIPGPKYKIIGDCYLQEWMDGEGDSLALDDWEDLTLV